MDIREPTERLGQVRQYPANQLSAWQHWLQHPERVRLRNAVFQVHLMLGAVLSAYVFLMSISGSVIVNRDQLAQLFSVEWLVHLHSNLSSGLTGRLLNGIGAIVVTMICLTGAVIWWPGMKHWRRSMSVNWRAPFARTVWDLYSALGFWSMLLLLVWGITGTYFAFPRGRSMPFSFSIPPTGLPTESSSGLPKCTLAGSAGSLARSGASWDSYPQC